MGSKARVIITQACNRNCPNCANTQERAMSALQDLHDYEELRRFDEIIITGGEPMLVPNEVIEFVDEMKKQKPDRKVYLYSASVFNWTEFAEVVDVVDGLHFTIHAPASDDDIEDFHGVQAMLQVKYHNSGKSFRLYIQEGVEQAVRIRPTVWSRIEMKQWLEECPLPEGEELFLWKG